MKRSLFIAIVVLLMAALFVSCNAEKSMKDQLVEVTIAGGSRALSATGALDADVDTLYWYYTAEKTSGYFKTGEHLTLTPVKEGKGLASASLGTAPENSNEKVMSTGGWKFCFYGLTAPLANPENTTKAQARASAVFYQEDLRKTINGSIELQVSLTRGEGTLGAPVAEIEDGELFWVVPENPGFIGAITLKVFNNDTQLGEAYIGSLSEGKYVFTQIADINLTADVDNTLAFKVFSTYTDNGVTLEEQLGEAELVIGAKNGMKYTITSDEVGIDFSATDVVNEVAVGAIDVPVITTNTVESVPGGSKVVASNTPAGTATTTVVFSEDLAGKELTVVTSSAEVASTKSFSVSDGSTTVASIELTLSEGNIGTNGTATITTYIETGLSNVVVKYAGNPNESFTSNYDPDTGMLTFTTSHFSEFYVTSTSVAKIGNRAFGSFEAAVAAAQNGDTITLIANYTVSAEKIAATDRIIIDKAITIDFGAYKLIVPGELEPTANWAALYVDADTTFEATTGGIECLDKVSGGCGVYAVNVRNGATLTINGGYYHGGGTAIQVQLGKAIINDGEIWATNYEEPYNNGFVLNCVDSAYNAGNASFEVCGGTFRYFNPADNVAESANTNFVAEGFASIPVENEVNTWTVVPAVFAIGNVGYATLPDACKAALRTEGDTVITLLCDASGDGFSPDDADLGSYTIDFNGHTFDVTGLVGSTGTQSQAFRVIEGQNVTLKNGTLTSSNARMLINQYGNLTLKDMILDGSQLDGSNRYTLSNNSGTTTITGNTQIIAQEGGFGFDVWGAYSSGKKSITVIADENFTGSVSGKIEYTASTSTGAAKLIIKAGDFTNATMTVAGTFTDDSFVSIEGGVFGFNPTAYLATGHSAVESNGSWTVSAN